MPILSMTGFGASSGHALEGPGHRCVDVEVRSVNARFLEIRLKQPFGAKVEPLLRERIAARVGRGRVEFAIHVRSGATAVAEDARGLTAFGVDVARLTSSLEALGEVEAAARRAGLEVSAPNALELLRFSTSWAERSATSAEVTTTAPEAVWTWVEEALDELVSFRRNEGQALTEAIGALAETLREQVRGLADERPREHERLRHRVAERVAEACRAIDGGTVDPVRLAQEVAILLSRGDIEEELARLEAHLDHLQRTLAAPASKGQGKTLDFLAQELHREVNTIASKLTSHDGSRIAVEAKSTIERIREQVQNVE